MNKQDDVRADYMGSHTLASGKVLSIFDNGGDKLGIVVEMGNGYFEIAISDLPSFIQVFQEMVDERAEAVAWNAEFDKLVRWNQQTRGAAK